VKQRKGFTLIELLVVVAIIALLISILLPSLSRARELAKRAVCGSNQRSIGQGMHIYSNDNEEWFPHHFFSATITGGTGTAPPQHGITWVGTLGNGLDYQKETSGGTGTGSTSYSTNSSHPSRSLFLLVAGGQSTVGLFNCPSAGDTEDDLRNTPSSGNETAAIPGKNRYDFKSYGALSYGYQLPYGNKARPTQSRDSQMPLTADKGPYYEGVTADKNGLKGGSDVRSGVIKPDGKGKTLLKDLLQLSNEDWTDYNSRNHGGEGQNIMFVDGHVDFERRPIEGVNNDNIYTIMEDNSSIEDSVLGQIPDAGQKLGPNTQTDSFIVP
jgi:prepilin-type N-terminal cleavage/methylation domain-containing protein/prepilin-type processing-associated H-X9-DG protein